MNSELRSAEIATDIAAALTVSETGGEAIKNIHRVLKKANPHFSLAVLCRKAGIPSTGYLSDVMCGKRLLHQKHHKGLIAALSLQSAAADYLNLILLCSAKGKAKAADTGEMSARLQLAKKNLFIQYKPMPDDQQDLFFSLEVFCAFGLFKNRPNLDELCGFYGDEKRKKISHALATLTDMNLVVRDTEDLHRYVPSVNQVLFNKGAGGLSHLDFLKLTFSKASKDVGTWFERRDQAHFSSSIISVKASDYRKYLPVIKHEINAMQSKLEEGNADSLIRFNVQIYPLEGNDQ